MPSSLERYVIVEPLASGGMGDLYRGQRVGPSGFRKEVALKRLRPDLARDGRISALFLQEARLTAGLDHPNIVSTLDVLQGPEGLFIVMEYVHGADLMTVLRKARRQGRRLSVGAALFLGQSLLAALEYLHGQTDERGAPLGLLHRDVSPGNVLLSAVGAVMLSDFGIAGWAHERGDAAVPQLEGFQGLRVRGKIGYMAPEQARGEPIDARADLFAAAVVLYEVLVGERLFIGAGEGAQQSPAQIYGVPVPPPSRRRAEVPVELDRILGKALSLTPDGRHANARALREALREVAWQRKLVMGAPELGEELRLLCGDEPRQWRHEDERTGTASIGAADLGDDEDPLEEHDSARRGPPLRLRPGAGRSEVTGANPAVAVALADSGGESDATMPVERFALGEATPPMLRVTSALRGAGDDTGGQPLLTVPLPREAVAAALARDSDSFDAGDGGGIAAMARRMVPSAPPRPSMAPQPPHGSPGRDSQPLREVRPLRDLHSDATSALSGVPPAPLVREVPAETRQIMVAAATPATAPKTVLNVVSDSLESVRRGPLLTQRNLLLAVVAMFLLGMGVVFGMALSGPARAPSASPP